MPRPLAPFRIGGKSVFLSLNDDVPVELEEEQASVLTNLYRERGKLTRRAGTAPLGSAALSPDQDHDGLAWFKIGATEVLFAAHNGSVVDWLAGTPGATLTNSAGKLTAGRDASFAWLDGKVYAGDGVKQNVRLTATRADQAMVDAAGAGAAAADGGAGNLNGAYQWKIVFLSADGIQGEASPAFPASPLSLTNRQASLTLIPTCPAGQECSGRRIYRTKAAGTTWYQVADIRDNTTTVFTDNVADTALVTAIVAGNTRMPPCQGLFEYQNRLIGFGNTTETNGLQTLFISGLRQPYWCPASPDLTDPTQGTRITLQGPAAGTITAGISAGDVAYVWTGGACWTLIADQPLDFALKPFTPHGCVAHRTVARLGHMIFWAAPDGVYRIASGEPVRRISDPIRNGYLALTATQLSQMHAFVYDQRYYLCYDTGAWYYDARYEMWGSLAAWPWRCSAVSQFTGTTLPRIFGARKGTARAWQMETGTTDNGAAISTTWATGDLDLGNPGREKRLHYVGATWKLGQGTATVKLYRSTGLLVETITQDLSVPEETGGNVARLFQRVGEGARSEHFKLQIDHADATAPDYALLAADGNWSLAT